MGSCISTHKNIQSIMPHMSSPIHSKHKNTYNTNTEHILSYSSTNNKVSSNSKSSCDTKYPYDKSPHQIDISKSIYDTLTENTKCKIYKFYFIINIIIKMKCTHTEKRVYIRQLKALYAEITSLMLLSRELPVETQFAVSVQLIEKIRIVTPYI